MTLSGRPAARPLVAGDRLDRYELLCPLAEGGMAAVWLANQRGSHGFNKRVALKTILPTFATEPGFRPLFMDESRIASRIHHENVAQVLDLGDDQGVLYLVIEWIDGESLRTLERVAAKDGVQLPHGILLRVLADTCAGLHAAHELCDELGQPLKVVHRDISPQNILVCAHGATKIIDFGIAKARDRLSKETTPGIVRGKQQYMAPEQALGLSVDRRADVWAVAAVFYRVVTGRPVFDASKPLETIELMRKGRIAAPLGTRSEVHAAVSEVMDVALSPDPGSRFRTAAEMRAALEGAMKVAGLGAGPVDVAAFAMTHLGARRAARHAAIRAALGIAEGPSSDALDGSSERSASASSNPQRADRTEVTTVRPGAYRIIEEPSSSEP